MNRQAFTIAIVCCVGMAIYISSQMNDLSEARKNAVTVFTNDGKGMSLFHKFTQNLEGVEFKVYKRAFLYPEDLKDIDAVAIHSPKIGLSKKEIKNLTRWVHGGGKLFLSAHSEATWERIHQILGELSIEKKFKYLENEEFENYKFSKLNPSEESTFFKTYHSYAFYSPIFIGGEDCALESFACYVQMHKAEKGEVLLLAGLPLNSNSLIQLENNRFFAFEITRWAPRILVDEFHHLFPSKSLSELFFDWKYSLPLIGLFLGSILFFILAKKPEESLLEDAVKLKSLHEVGENLVATHLKQKEVSQSAHERYRQYLVQEFPHSKEEIESTKRFYASANKDELKRLKYEALPILELHKELIKSNKGVMLNDTRSTDRSAHL